MQNADVWRIAYEQPHDVVAYGLSELVKNARGHMIHFTVTRLVKTYLRTRYGINPPKYRTARYFTKVAWLLQWLCAQGLMFCRLQPTRPKIYWLTDISPLWTTDPKEIERLLPRRVPRPEVDFERISL